MNMKKIGLYRSPTSDLCEFTDESDYFKKVNEIWKEFQGLFIFYVIPDKTRTEMESYKDKVRDHLTKKIAEAYASH